MNPEKYHKSTNYFFPFVFLTLPRLLHEVLGVGALEMVATAASPLWMFSFLPILLALFDIFLII